jgi:hypothetical protein
MSKFKAGDKIVCISHKVTSGSASRPSDPVSYLEIGKIRKIKKH